MAVVLFLGESRKLQIIWAKSVNAVLYHTFDEKGNNSVWSLKHTVIVVDLQFDVRTKCPISTSIATD